MYNAPKENLPGVHLYDEYRVCKELESLRKECDYLIVVYHGGSECFRYPSPQIKMRFHRMVDSGANIVLSQHTHCVGTEEYYKGSYLLYGQGNFLFRSFNNEFTDTGILVEVVFEGDNVTVKKHMVRAVADTVRYDEMQDFTEFDKRSSLLYDENLMQSLSDEYCLNELPIYLNAFKGRAPLHIKVLKRFFPLLYRKYLFASYTRRFMLQSLHTLRSEQNREIAIRGLEVYLNRSNDSK